MSIGELLARGQRSISFEFFPPKNDEGEEALWHTLHKLEALQPTFVSVTYGAGGSTRDRTVRITGQIASRTSLRAVAHLTCVGSDVEDLRSVVRSYADAGIGDILALRGDPVGGPNTPWVSTPGGIDHAVDLVRLIKEWGSFGVGVAAFPDKHPESVDLDQDARVLAMKQDAGAEFAVTQFFFDVADYVALRDRAAAHGCTMPIVPGLMPVTDVRQLVRFAQLSGAAVPDRVVRRFDGLADDPQAVHDVGVEVATEMSLQLLAEGAPGIHFFTLNKSTSAIEVYESIEAAV